MVACTTRAMPINMQFSSVFQDLNFVLRGSSANPSRPHQTSHDPFPLRTSPVGRAECMNFPQRKDTGPPGRCIELIVWLDVIPIDHHEVPGKHEQTVCSKLIKSIPESCRSCTAFGDMQWFAFELSDSIVDPNSGDLRRPWTRPVPTSRE